MYLYNTTSIYKRTLNSNQFIILAEDEKGHHKIVNINVSLYDMQSF